MRHLRKAQLPVRRRVQEHARATYRDAILDVVARQLPEVGLAALKMSDVAAEVGVSVGTLYHYFDGKDALIAALLERENSLFFARLEASRTEQDPLLRLRSTIEQALRFIDERGALLAVFAQVNVTSEANLRRVTGGGYHGNYTQFRDLLIRDLAAAAECGAVRNDLAPEELGAALGGILSSAIYSWVSGGRQRPLADRAARVFDLFLNGAKPS